MIDEPEAPGAWPKAILFLPMSISQKKIAILVEDLPAFVAQIINQLGGRVL